ncbi:uncharacterized protein BKCO1_700008 [Diplodia corticola]|uniref:Uncharacterized protein n=1 Tax=Diplodia corticola TaxID=236234 RepID=A0A1J9QLW9_9PEZI|nr:uncharacterized protein BKCO1_700008 [Diplodia corticola]OJD29902.1 hypothetical protein BKCO1_700008 [Diplodia corticola]
MASRPTASTMKYTTVLLALLPALGYAQDAYGPHCSTRDRAACQLGRCIYPVAGSYAWTNDPVCVVPCSNNACKTKCQSQDYNRKYQVGYCHSIGKDNFCLCTDKTFF